MANLNYIFVLIIFVSIISSGIHIFSRGFLLTRSSRTEKRNCDKININLTGERCLNDDKKSCSNLDFLDVSKNISFYADKICLERKSKVVIFLIDALKYEFGVYDENLKNPLSYQNKLPIIHQLLKQEPEHTRLLKFVADPPTTTLQRLKGITTGSLPTFIDMGSNFATPEINEDNIIDQIISNNKTAVFLGDQTWIELFPKRFKRAYPHPSFNIHDLDTVDNAILKNLPQELAKNDWDLIIAHFLGVDHCGHKFGPYHREMSRKLTEMNDVIKKYVETIDNDTMLIVMGDHGMTDSGDHGGSSDDETEALLFAYSKHKPFISKSFDNYVDNIQQIDLTSTLSTILGVPIPFSNLGSISFQLLPDISNNEVQRRESLLMHLWHNAKQIKNYLDVYSNEHDKVFSYDDLDNIDLKYEMFEFRVNTIFSDEGFKSVATDIKNNMNNMLEMCRNIWIKFNPKLMTQGMLITFVGIFTAFIIVNNIPPQDFHQILNSKLLITQACSCVIASIIGYFLSFELGYDDEIIAILFMSSLCNILFFGFVIIQNWTTIVDMMSATKKIINLVPRLTFAFSIVVFFSNSFIIQEQRILCFLLSVQIIYAVYEIRRSTTLAEFKGLKFKFLRLTFFKIITVALICITLLRLSSNYFKCREEQGDCWDYLTNSENVSNEPDKKLNFIPVITLALLVALVRGFLKANGNLTGFSPHVLLIRFGPTISVIAACGYLVLSQKQLKRPIVSYVHLDTLALIVYGIFLLEILIVSISPLLIYTLPRNTDKVNLTSYNNIIPELYRHIKNVFNEQNKTQIPIVYGLATVYSSIFIAFGTILSIMLALLLGVNVCNGFLIVLTVGFGVLFIYSILRYESATTIKDCLQPSFSLIVTWYLLYSYGFYSTSHQPTISRIDWNAAFVGRTANFDHSNIISAILVLLSTFNSNLVLLILYPLLVFAPFMIYSIWPNLSLKTSFVQDKKGNNKDDMTSEYRKITLNDDGDSIESTSVKSITRGEISLYENENLFLGSTFKVGCQLIVLQGTKTLASMIACTILCRHLMVWKIFAPRFIYEGIASYISFIAILIGFMLLIRVHKSVKSLVNKINKNC
ncbi:hypothetical protein PVAND_007890 [Polypedilum vanderplanki]|uniref:GPI ethanolamine phosphate transferase 3, catalytic subunit n=1 Tax=Polypedilum vanderplanki TaxID=319348 RepID=A0A9J6C8D3_POLVA|nr:hypothetical protein PVAND_007890 [Polypedilum vanderplanki]